MSGNNYVMKEPVMVEAEMVALFRHELGPVWAWTDFIRDARRGRHPEYDLPFAFKAGGRYYYHLSDVTNFIAQVRDVIPDAPCGLPIIVQEAAHVTNGRKVTRIGKYSALSEKAKKKLLH